MRRPGVLRSLSLPLMACTLAWWLSWPQSISSHGTLTTTVLFDREVVRILDNHCVMCHDDRALSFPLVTYEQTWVRRTAVRAAILGRHMPPWPAVAGYGQFVNANSLTLREKQFVVGWVEGLGPRNAGQVFLNVADPRAARTEEVRATSHAGHWQLGEPNLARSLEARTIAAREGDVIVKTAIDLGLTSEQRVRAIEYMPGDRRVVRAAVFTLEQTGQWLGSWTPWYGFAALPEGVSYRLPARARIVAEIHYRSIAEPVIDRGTVGLFFADRSATREERRQGVPGDREERRQGVPGDREERRQGVPGDRVASDLTLEASAREPSPASTVQLRATARVPADTYVWALRPDFGPGVKSIEVSARRADGSTEILLFARDPSPEWPTPFILKQPRLIRRGTELSLVAHTGGSIQPLSPVRVTVSRF